MQWKEELYTNCPVQVFGPITNAIFYLGPSRSLTGDDSSWLFAKLSASDANGFWATFQTSPLDGNKPLPNSWYINAELNYTGYEISGRVPLESGTGPGAEAGNALRGKLAVKEDAGICGLEEDAVFELTYQPVSTVLGGYVDGESAMVTINGTYTSSDNTRRIAYSFVFDGKRDVSSAKIDRKSVV